MCGILLLQSFDHSPVNNALLNMYDAQKTRGMQGFGLFDASKGHLVKATKEDKILKWLTRFDSDMILFHHRWPTSTENVRRAAHPFSTKQFFKHQYILVHNGVIRNAKELKEEHEKRGIHYQSVLDNGKFNDSEALLWDFALVMEGKKRHLTAKGDMAFICLKVEKNETTRVYFGRNHGRPLCLERDGGGFMLSSENPLAPCIEVQTLFTWNPKVKRLTHRDFMMPEAFTPYAASPPRYAAPSWDNDDDGFFQGWVYDADTESWLSPDEQRTRDELARQTGQPGDWLPDELRRKFGMMLQKTGYTRASAPALPATVLPEQTVLEEDTTESLWNPLPGQTESLALEYLTKAEGNFEAAYWLVEGDYALLFEGQDLESSGNVRKRILLERVMQHIETDPEKVLGNDVSSIWGGLQR